MNDYLDVIDIIPGSFNRHKKYVCKCTLCGKISTKTSSAFRQGKGCKCQKHLYGSLIGKVFGLLTVIAFHKRNYESSSKNAGHQYLCRCNFCGKESIRLTVVLNGEKFVGCDCVYDKDKSSKDAVYKSYIRNAKTRNIEFNLDYDFFIELCSKNCFYCGDGPSNHKKVKDLRGEFFYNGIDRCDNSIGYIKENVVTACRTCNFMKKNMSKEKFLSHINKIAQKQNEEK